MTLLIKVPRIQWTKFSIKCLFTLNWTQIVSNIRKLKFFYVTLQDYAKIKI